MEIALSKLSLVFASSLPPIAAGVYIVLLIAAMRHSFNNQQIQRIMRTTIIPPVILAIAGITFMLGLASPQNSIYVLTAFGRSPLTYHIVAFSLFFITSVVFWLGCIAGKFDDRIKRSTCIAILVVLGFITTLLTGFTYELPAVPVWYGSKTILQPLSIELFGGVLLGMLMCSLGGKQDPRSFADELVCKVIVIIGAAMLIVSNFFIFSEGSALVSALVNIQANSQSLRPFFLTANACIIISSLFVFIARKKTRPPFLFAGMTFAFIAIFCSRFVYFGMLISAGV